MSNYTSVLAPRDVTFPKVEVEGAPHWPDNPVPPQIELLLPE